jgi:hypothetical protein
MNDDRIERDLRRRGPREVTTDLPTLPPDITAARAELRRLGRGHLPWRALGVGFGVLAGATIAAAIAIAMTAPPLVDVGNEPSAAPTATPGIGPCQVSALEASAEAWGAAAGSRGTTITVVNTRSVACTLRGHPGAAIGDDQGVVWVSVEGGVDAAAPALELGPGQTAITSVVWGNWCGDPSSASLSLTLTVDGSVLTVTPDASAPEVLVPPCLGTDATSLSTIDFQRP